ncbi:DNA-protecting protein DprA [Hydrogenovibrio sp. SC-1]|uniref:DNA-processing protein DprA n=1 Tax=Hydrogenovibrio sp. SC-1 TaxID=2065820 RepID=UPI000C7C7AC5|nr:DNA-processing protein DprA [Hydrogenovibrio sp. SC-1]PLA75222.1 DNA-protecting protein DprA [Hydrogenovibrio sp. SC-1]
MSDIDTLKQGLNLHFAQVRFKQIAQIEGYFGSLEQAMVASGSAWQQAQILTPKQFEKWLDADKPKRIDEAIEWAQQSGQGIVTWQDSAYPPLLKQIADPPLLLYVRGDIQLLSQPQLAMVGSRNASKTGRLIASDFAQYLASVGLVVTSGLASGIDKAAHEGALNALKADANQSSGTTIAVVATGLDRVYPATNRDLARQIAETGAMVSEYPLGVKPMAYHFPQRNRIISGLSLGTLVVEAALKSGSLITARTALEQDREVFAVPGSIHNPQVKGCHQLIRQGAKLVESGEDILEELSAILQSQLKVSAKKPSVNQEPALSDNALMAYLDFEPIGLDELVSLTGWSVAQLQSELLMLELRGELEALSAGRWRRLR